jgi:hypothetical protein
MKVFAIITAVAMSATGGIYYFTGSGCPFQGACEKPQAATGCTSCSAAAKPSCCEVPCPGCATNCQTCCDDCELCCSASATKVRAAKPAKPSCCDATCAGCPTGCADCTACPACADSQVKAGSAKNCCAACDGAADTAAGAAAAAAALK